MNTLERKQYEELGGRLAALSGALRLHWPAPAEARDEEVAITAHRRWTDGRPALVLSVACSLRLLPVLRQHGYRWALHRAGTGEQVVGDRVLGRLIAELPDLPDGEYFLDMRLLRRQLGVSEWRLPPAQLAAKSAADPSPQATPYDVVAEFRSPSEGAAEDGTRAVQLRRSPSRIVTLWVELTGPAAEGGLARFTVRAPGAESPRAVGFVGIDERGEGEINLSRFDYRLQLALAPDDTIALQPLWLEDLVPDDRADLERSRDAAVTGRAALDAALDALGNRTGG